MSPRNTYPCPDHITSKNAEVPKFPAALKRYGTQISLDITFEIWSQVIVGRGVILNLFVGADAPTILIYAPSIPDMHPQ